MHLSVIQDSYPVYLQSVLLGEPDPRVSKWFMLKSPVPIIGILLAYYSTVFLSREFMKSRKAFNLKWMLILHNSFQIVLSCYIFKEVLLTVYLANYNLACQSVDTSMDPLAMRMADVCWWFFISKLTDLIDTMFFVLRKKDSQLTFLHVYHHSSMVVNYYFGTLYMPGGQAYVSVLLNSLVHAIMYSYYLLSALGPTMQRYLWWKRYLTQIQLVQFVIVIGHIFVGHVYECGIPPWLAIWSMSYTTSMVLLFANFYHKAYLGRKAKPE